MNIGIIIPWFPSGALEGSFFGNFHHSQAKKLVEMGHKVIVIAGHQPGMPASEELNGILVYRFLNITIPKIRYAMPNVLIFKKFITAICRHHRLEVLEVFNSDFITSIPALYINKQLHIPVVVVVNGLPGISWFTGDKFIDSAAWFHTNLIAKRIIKAADGVRILNEGLYSEVLKFSVDRSKIRTIHFGVNTNIFSPCDDKVTRAGLGLNEDDFLVLYVGRLVKPLKMKGIIYLVDAVKELIPHCKKIKLVVVGDGDATSRSSELTKSIKDHVIFTGYRSDVYNFMSAADVLVLPSLAEGCPNVVLEAMACGTPVVASRVGAVPELIEDGKTGFIVRPGNVPEIKKALLDLMLNASLKQTMGEMARERMVKHFTWDISCKKLEKFYVQLIDNYEMNLNNYL